mmetsp:Transcript_32611/g.56631  ORF Transcript_32611/g.56631 Transcript_32611/m.56631 type:complete len:191 (-) Transcript_32611:1075-1647(-)|eukprot:CAMPEP_0204901192 /NCGR_PEP_ID=MMETSP1397-20131031/2936_1 /ASSEMBLY_ACC=CAM_ASM_000891 /TAXON_ID=49980 /ORGANISM="Climacostomum Climacostomum virens, Strain Stock W-24" /LENGTH=190 /DNA_ID=CAMNT_0052069503 /DNA_START=29 /DNA_END=601 /DNA_ORIENTATION=+
MEREPHHKVVVLGNSNVGKTCLVNRLARDTFSEAEPTIGANFLTKALEVDSEVKSYDIWDTAGQERYRSLTPMYYRGAAIAIVVFDLGNCESFEGAKSWVRELQTNASTGSIIGLLGNKLDIKRAVSRDVAIGYASVNGLFYEEVSAKTGENVKEAFIALAKKLPKVSRLPVGESRKLAKKPDAPKSTCC